MTQILAIRSERYGTRTVHTVSGLTWTTISRRSPDVERIKEAIIETEDAKARAERYMPEHRDVSLIAFYVRHLAKLHAMLAIAA